MCDSERCVYNLRKQSCEPEWRRTSRYGRRWRRRRFHRLEYLHLADRRPLRPDLRCDVEPSEMVAGRPGTAPCLGRSVLQCVAGGTTVRDRHWQYSRTVLDAHAHGALEGVFA